MRLFVPQKTQTAGFSFEAKNLFVSTNDSGIPVLRDRKISSIRAFKLARHPWRVYHGGTVGDASVVEMLVINDVYAREGKERP